MAARLCGWQTERMTSKTRKRWLIAGAVVLTLIAAAGVVLFIFRDRATPAQQEDVEATLVTGGGQPGDYGLYLYATTGFEETDALGGSRHEYPSQTYMTIQPGGCGTLVRWKPLEQRWDEWDYCEGGALAGRQNYHEWFTMGNLDAWTCSPAVPSEGEPGETWTGSCSRTVSGNVEAAAEVTTYEVVGYETLTVGADQVETLHIRTASTGSGGTSSSDTADTWILPGTPLVVRQTASGSSTNQSRIGPVAYHEEYEIRLISLSPSA